MIHIVHEAGFLQTPVTMTTVQNNESRFTINNLSICVGGEAIQNLKIQVFLGENTFLQRCAPAKARLVCKCNILGFYTDKNIAHHKLGDSDIHLRFIQI